MTQPFITSGPHDAVVALGLVIAANAAPVLLGLLLGRAGAWPLDGGRCWRDGRRVLGGSKTWRGLLVSLAATAALSSWWLGDPQPGLAVAALAMLGDLASSFVKRRAGLRSGADAPLLDQLPESLLPLLWLRGALGLGWGAIALVLLAFLLLDLLGTRLAAPLRARRERNG